MTSSLGARLKSQMKPTTDRPLSVVACSINTISFIHTNSLDLFAKNLSQDLSLKKHSTKMVITQDGESMSEGSSIEIRKSVKG